MSIDYACTLEEQTWRKNLVLSTCYLLPSTGRMAYISHEN